jgi:hypothetical protein
MNEIIELSYKKLQPKKALESTDCLFDYKKCKLCGLRGSVMYRSNNGNLCFNCYHSHSGVVWKKS